MRKDNLSPKLITDFTKEDTIYIQIEERKGHPEMFLCQFIEYKFNGVYGKVISSTVNESLYVHKISEGFFIDARLNKCSLYGEDPTSKRTFYHWFKDTGYAIYPKEYNKENEDGSVIKDHPSYGMIGISRISSSRGVNLFGSSIQHKQTMMIRIYQAENNRSLNQNNVFAKQPLIEVEMSGTQFAEFITTANVGSGVPCTIKHVGMNTIPETPFESKKDLFTAEFTNKMKNLMSDIEGDEDIITSILDKKTSITKKDREEIRSLFENYRREIASNLPFVASQFNEQMDQTVLEAKGEVESFIAKRLTDAGKKALLGENGEAALLND